MSNNLRFSIEESVCFEKGQEINDLLSVSLEPDVVVDEYGDYVSVRGTLQLVGEFLLFEGDDRPEESDMEEQMPYRVVQEVEKTDQGTASFRHHFPVDITIPHSRVNEPDDIYVQVESFDYRLVNRQLLQLTAELDIAGIAADKKLEVNLRDDEDESMIDGSELVEVDVKKEASTENTQAQEEVEHEEALVRSESISEQTEPEIEMKSRTEESDQEQTPESEESTLIGFVKNIDERRNDHETEDEETKPELKERDENDGADENDDGVERSHQKENALYLTKMLMREDEDSFSKLKMRIIQPGDSLDAIAERYEVTPSHLARMNQLEEEEVVEGQILYIPTSTNH